MAMAQKHTDIRTIKALHEFAIKYLDLYSDPQTAERDVFDGFADQCFAIGLEMDCGKKFIEIYSQAAFYHAKVLKMIINNVNDAMVLGSAIFSHWRYVTHWSYGESLLDDDHKEWFQLAFAQLKKISEEQGESSL